MEERPANTPLDRVQEEIAPLIENYNKTTDELKNLYSKTYDAKKEFLLSGIEYTKLNDPEDKSEEGLSLAYQKCKDLLEQRVQISKDLLSEISTVLVSIDNQLHTLDAPYDPKFGIQTQNPRIFKTNKTLSMSLNESPKDHHRTYCICNKPPHGNMIACDAFHMDSPWYHMECVECLTPPKGQWLCPKCRPIE
ncbi:hypothetical protein NEOKW01_0507 [Nematocida sp. AWRm80]|nr:hypothetical protein NEOKW01_0507 [Nematocida sp. AWRm80]